MGRYEAAQKSNDRSSRRGGLTLANFFQSQKWWDFQAALGEQVFAGSGDGWHYHGRLVKDSLGKYLYLPYGPVVRDERALREACAHARGAARSAGAYRLLVEPSLPITPETAKKNFATQRFGFNPSRSQIIDLELSADEIVAAMSTTRRKQHRGAARKGMHFYESTSREDFNVGVELLRASGETKSFKVRDETYFESFYEHLLAPGTAKMFVAKQDDEIQVVAFVIDDDDTRYYLYVGRDLSNNSLQISAPFISFMILDAKEAGLKYFDLFGISASDEVEDSMTGFTVFKRTFGGKTVQYAGTWELGVNPLKYTARRVLDLVQRRKKRAAN